MNSFLVSFVSTKMKSFAILYIQIGFFTFVQTYDQLVKPGVTVAESSSVGWGGIPSRTVDGDKTQSHYTYCMHTAPGQTEAWLRVDLGEVYNLKSVKLWYRNDKVPPRNTKRLEGFSVRLSNTSRPVPSDTCYQDPGNQTLPVVLERDCRGVARYVWFYTDKNNDGYAVFLEICEVEIYGCPDKHFGEKCRKCDACGGHCDVTNGKCQCLQPGYQPPSCNIGCTKGFYGSNCVHSCGKCYRNESCDPVNGFCPSEHCELGWKSTIPRKCDQECDDGKYGYNCRNNCSDHCAGGSHCRKTDGVCPGGCADGWRNHYCKRLCKKRFYGTNCSRVCGHCRGNATCHHINGSCPSGHCEPGWKYNYDKKCDQECDDGSYGLYCRNNCSGQCAGELPCRKTDGVCPGGCMNGRRGSYCNEKLDMEVITEILDGKTCIRALTSFTVQNSVIPASPEKI